LIDLPTSNRSTWSAELISQGSEVPSSVVLVQGSSSEKLIVRLPANTSGPVRISKVQSHLEAKIPTQMKGPSLETEVFPIHDATTLASMHPTVFACASCSLPLVRTGTPEEPSRSVSYFDLPSDHWAEFVESWICHRDLPLSPSYTRRGRQEIQPSALKILVGGSHILCHQSLVHEEDLSPSSPIKVGEAVFLSFIFHLSGPEESCHRPCSIGGLLSRTTFPLCERLTHRHHRVRGKLWIGGE